MRSRLLFHVCKYSHRSLSIFPINSTLSRAAITLPGNNLSHFHPKRHALQGEILWPNAEERHCLGSLNWNFLDCIGLIDGTLVEIIKKIMEECFAFQVIDW